MLAVRFVLMTGEAEFAKEGPWAYHTATGAASAENPGPTDAAAPRGHREGAGEIARREEGGF